MATVLHGKFATLIPAAIPLARTLTGLRIGEKGVCIPYSIVKHGGISNTLPFLKVSRRRKRKNIGLLSIGVNAFGIRERPSGMKFGTIDCACGGSGGSRCRIRSI